MAYIEYVACDKCGNDMLLAVDTSFGITFARTYARRNGWQIGKRGWLCPKCCKKKKENAKEVAAHECRADRR